MGTNLHVPLETGAWQVRIYELGEAKSTATSVGDLMKALKFDDAKNTTFTLKVSFPLPKKMASGKFSANLVAVDQAKANYMCLDIKYSYTAPVMFTALSPAHCTKDSDCPSSYCQHGTCHACGDECCLTDKDCPGSYCANDPTKMPPYTCHGKTNFFNKVPMARNKLRLTEKCDCDWDTCRHHVDAADNKCYEACALGIFSDFKMKGLERLDGCPYSYKVVTKKTEEQQCSDGKTNVKYCSPPLRIMNITLETKARA